MGKTQNEISIIGFSSIASLVSLLLAERGIENTYQIEKMEVCPLEFRPVANPLTNGPAQLIEKGLIIQDYFNEVCTINNFNFQWYNEHFQKYSQMKGIYKSPVYAIDNRIRFYSFLEKIRNTNRVNLIEYKSDTEFIDYDLSSVNILGGERYSSQLEKNECLSTKYFKTGRLVFLFNLACENEILKKYNNVNMISIDNIGEITIYPFLHVSNKKGLNVTFTINKGSSWDCFDGIQKCDQALQKAIDMISLHFPELALDLQNTELLDNFFTVLNINPFYNRSVKYIGENIFFGVGESITKNDPILGQGYNNGVVVGMKLIEAIESYLKHKNQEILVSTFCKYADQQLEYLYHINRAFTQGTDNIYVNQIYGLASKNEFLSKLIASAYDDISNYFPWLTDQRAAKELVEKYQ